jgi:hypothetical protein
MDKEQAIAVPSPPIDLCMANEPRPTNGRPENGPFRLSGRLIAQANINKTPRGYETPQVEKREKLAEVAGYPSGAPG